MDISDANYFINSWWPYIISGVVSIIVAIRTYMGGPQCPSASRVDNKVVLITGGSGGLGLATAIELALRGATVILTCRNMVKGKLAIDKLMESVPGAKIDLRELDVADMSKIRAFVTCLQNEYQKIDILINNAGLIFLPFQKTVDNIEVTFATNYLGPFLLTHLLLPLLHKSENGRVINISAQAHYVANVKLEDLNREKQFTPREAFGQSKLALVLFTRHLAKLCTKTTITINVVNPGIVRNTEHLRNSSLQASFISKLSVWPWMWLFLKTPNQGCQTVVYAAVDPSLYNVSGIYLSDCESKEPAEIAQNESLAAELYQRSCEMCGIEENIVESLARLWKN